MLLIEKTLQTGLIISALFLFHASRAQQDTTDLLSLLGEEEQTIDYTIATFKSTRVINMHSVENVAAGHLDFRISHRFGTINSGAQNLWGLDQAYMRLGFEYGVTDRLMAGFGRSNVNKEIDGFVKLSDETTCIKNQLNFVLDQAKFSNFGLIVVQPSVQHVAPLIDWLQDNSQNMQLVKPR